MKTENYEVPHNAVLYVPFLNFVSDKKILLSATLWNILSPCSCLRLTHQVSDACKTTGKTAVLYILISTLLAEKWEEQILSWMVRITPREYNLLLVSSWMKLWYIIDVPKYLTIFLQVSKL